MSSLLHFQLLPKEHVARAYAIEIAEYPAEEAASLENLIYRHTQAPHLFMGCYLRPTTTTNTITNTLTTNNNGHDDEQHHHHHHDKKVFVPTQDDLIGYIVSTQASGETLTHHSMSHHDPAGDSVCIHSVCIARAFQRRGYALRMLDAYLAYLEKKKDLLCPVGASTGAGVDEHNPLDGGHKQQQQEQQHDQRNSLKRVLLIAHDELVPLYQRAGFQWVGKSEVSHGPDPWYEMKYNLKF
ncbi:hypothetical protein DFQ26_002112 [Actinomortierella ambigua]|nr:hypothetical protein DFQ26_002112 [Actinomortierella ambigua]